MAIAVANESNEAPVGVGATFTDEWEGAYRMWQNFHNEYPNKSFRLDGVTATVVVSHID